MVGHEAEEYLELLYRTKEKGEEIRRKDIAKELGITQASVTEMIKKLDKKGLVKQKPYRGVELTPAGERVGRKILRKHRFLERFLQYLGISGRKAHKEACKLEHYVSDDIEKALGKKIGAKKGWIKEKIIPLSQMKKGKKGRVAYIAGGQKVTQRLTDMGLTPGAKFSIQKGSKLKCPISVCIRGTCLCIGKEIAEKVFVEVS
jgi:DtxR family Mn-dependent transcriptional regulator